MSAVEPSAPEAAERAIEAAQRLVVERLELVRLDLQEALVGILRSALLAGIAILVGWATLVGALVALLQTWLLLPAALAVAGVVQLVIAAGVIASTGRPTRKNGARR
jgi:hypothetical protein